MTNPTNNVSTLNAADLARSASLEAAEAAIRSIDYDVEDPEVGVAAGTLFEATIVSLNHACNGFYVCIEGCIPLLAALLELSTTPDEWREPLRVAHNLFAEVVNADYADYAA